MVSATSVETADERHVDIQHDDMRTVQLDQLQGCFAIARLAHDGQVPVVFDHLSQALPDDGVIVRDHDLDLVIHRFYVPVTRDSINSFFFPKRNRYLYKNCSSLAGTRFDLLSAAEHFHPFRHS